ncbi:NAD(+) synthase [Alistipes sp. D31t1_170403_E11]|uniref:NAD(+) synthase n=1 Tax=Alistipes sp. D31t1_170403_E11 TaxID=2787128 RepID=UPI00189BB31D|nr:NAD(+) synthase [Alistipes sp. D31t1_170403_E11]
MDNFGFLKVAAAIPHVRVADCDYNTERMAAMAEEAARRGVEIVAFPELSVTAYTCGDLLLQPTLLDAADTALERLVRATRKLPLTLIAGVPLRHGSTLYNCAVVFTQGRVLGVVPKTHIPDYGEFYENRWFASGAGISEEHIVVAGHEADFGADLTFEINGTEFGIEICEDLWTAMPPSSQLALNGAKVIFNLSASPEAVGKHAYLRQLVAQQSARAIAAYVYCSAGFGESSTDLVFAGNGIIAENGAVLRESARFSPDEQLVVADVDIERLEFERRRNTSFRANEGATENTVIEMEIPEGLRGVVLDRDIDPMPFVPKDETDRSERCEEIFQIQSHGLAQRLTHTRAEKAVVGISGGLDSTLALLVTVRTFDKLRLDRSGIIGITMPGFGTTDRTYNNALCLMRGLGVTIREIPIRDACLQHFRDIGLDPADRSAAYENAQARERTQILMDVANMECGLVVGTGDLSELALGWATYNGDQMSMYGVNASVPKTLVRHLVKWAAHTEKDAATRAALLDIIDTPVSPELLPADAEGKITQKTEDLVGPYELHDFFLYNFLRAGYGPAKILLLAEQAFDGSYDRATILRWLTVFFRRFFTQQFKRSAMPDGPKVGSVALSPRGDWRMPSDASAAAWLRELDEL